VAYPDWESEKMQKFLSELSDLILYLGVNGTDGLVRYPGVLAVRRQATIGLIATLRLVRSTYDGTDRREIRLYYSLYRRKKLQGLQWAYVRMCRSTGNACPMWATGHRL
jgi:hypothetical protein